MRTLRKGIAQVRRFYTIGLKHAHFRTQVWLQQKHPCSEDRRQSFACLP